MPPVGDDLPADALEECAREPIRIPGSVQGHGALLAVTEPRLVVRVVSTNTDEVLGIPHERLLGAELAATLGSAFAATVRRAVTGVLDEVNPVAAEIGRSGAATAFDIVLHRTGGLLVLELEPAAGPVDGDGVDLSWRALRRPIRRLHDARTLADLARTTAEEVRALTGFDRVMVYRFDHEWNGEVVAEERRDDMEPYLGLRYPASDIPPQARELYRTSWLRLIAEVDGPTAPLVPTENPLDGAPLDLGHAALRSVSPVHLEYLRNMGVGASMSISLLDQGKLWGLIACHHDTPHRPRYAVRAAAELLGQTASLLLATTEDAEEYEAELALGEALARLLQDVAVPADDLAGHLLEDPEPLLTLTGAAGVALRLGTGLRRFGHTPPAARIDDVAAHLWRRATGNVAVTDRLAADDDTFLDIVDTASGVLAVRIDDRDDRWVMWFRPEELQRIDWGGDPRTSKVETAPEGTPRLHPRTSFARWSETVRLCALPWSERQVAAAATLGRHVGDVVRRRAQREAATAAGLQRALLLEHLPEIPGLSMAVRYVPAAHEPVGGDWYDLFFLADDRVGLTLGDVAGHGMEVAGIMAQLRHGLRAYLVRGEHPGVALAELNGLTHHLLPRELATVVVADYEPATARLRIANAGHLPPMLVRSDGEAVLTDLTRGPALGVLPDVTYGESVVTLSPGDTLLVFSDGLVERRGESIDDGLERLRAAASGRTGDVEALLDHLLDETSDDDVTILAIRADPVAGAGAGAGETTTGS